MNRSLLIYGNNAALLNIRKLVLRTAGDEVRTTTNPLEVKQMMQKERPEVLILCHTLSQVERVRILDLIPLLCLRTKALVLLAGRHSSPAEGHANLETLDGPRRLLQAVEELLSGESCSRCGTPSLVLAR